MKKIFVLTLALCSVYAAQAQSCVTIQQVSTNYATNQVTFDLKWGTCNNTNHLYRVWVFVDYRPIMSETLKGTWTRATISATNRGTLVSANKGVWVTGSANATQRVTLTLDVIGDKFDWCAFAIDYPPNATMNNGVYTLKGTPPFTLTTSSGTVVTAGNTYAGCITAITDATNCPGNAQPCCSGRDQAIGAVGCCSGLTAVGGYCRNLVADEATTYKSCNLEIKTADSGTSVWQPHNLCPDGWRWPTVAEMCCIMNYVTEEKFVLKMWWTSEEYNNICAYVLKPTISTPPTSDQGYRCDTYYGNRYWMYVNAQFRTSCSNPDSSGCKTFSHNVRCVR